MIFNAENFDIFRLGAVAVSYAPKNINTGALLVTDENVGALSLELETELRYNTEGEPFFNFQAARVREDNVGQRVLTVYTGDWLVILWNEIRIFRQEEFEKTFTVDHVDYEAMRKYAAADAKATEQLGQNVGGPKGILQGFQDPTMYETTMVESGVSPVGDRTEIVPTAGNLYPEGEGPQVGPNEQKLLDRRALKLPDEKLTETP